MILLRGYGLIFGADRPLSGFFVLVMTLPWGWPALLTGAFAARLTRDPLISCNAILLGLVWAWMRWPLGSLLPAMALGYLAFQAVRKRNFPPMVWGFLAAAAPAWMLWGPAPSQASLHPLTAFGAVIFQPQLEMGLTALLAVALHSRYAALLMLLGGLIGALTHSASAIFNAGLTASILGTNFLAPNPANVGKALLAAGVSAGLATVLPILVLPLHLTVAAASKLTRLSLQLETPEQRWARYARHWGQEVAWTLPFWGEWSVCQAPDGGWTHYGPWNEAWDFIVLDEQRRSHTGSGERLEDYYAFDLPLAAPAAGWVVRLRNDVPDNLPGRPDPANNWGNYVVLDHGNGLYTELSHFRQGSLDVVVGQWVERGQYLGRCGNSGMSCEPHVHIQLQASPEPGAPSLPSEFACYRVGRDGFTEPVLGGRPQLGERIHQGGVI